MGTNLTINKTGSLKITTRFNCLHCANPISVKTTEYNSNSFNFICEECHSIYTFGVAVTCFRVVKPWTCPNCGQEIAPNVTHDTSACH